VALGHRRALVVPTRILQQRCPVHRRVAVLPEGADGALQLAHVFAQRRDVRGRGRLRRLGGTVGGGRGREAGGRRGLQFVDALG
jgi:hypothetical protein